MMLNKKRVLIPAIIAIIICIGLLFYGISLVLNKSPNSKNEVTDTSVKQTSTFASLAGTETKKYNKAPDYILKKGINYKAKIRTNKGLIVIDLYEDITPTTVNNFVFLSKDGYYDGITFHRIIDGFMIQGGDPEGTGKGNPGYFIKDEHVAGSTNVKGTISMANAGPNTGGSQFFINLADNSRLDWDKPPEASKHPAFGIVVEGMDIVETIGKVKTDKSDKPLDPVIIETIEIVEEQI